MPLDELTYVSSPYSHDDPWVREERYRQVVHYCRVQMEQGRSVFSPIMHTHHVNKRIGARDKAFWMKQHLPILKACTKMEVLMLDGWKYSAGIKDELNEAETHGIPVEYIKP